MNVIYRTGIALYGLAARVLALFREKPRLWVRGRKNWRKKLKENARKKKGWIWFHCASLGEFEQGRPLIERIRREYPDRPLLLTFFSPSGYEIRKGYEGVDHVCYLPLDTRRNVRDFLDIVQPDLVFFIKYELWLNYLFEMARRGIPVLLVSAIVRPDSRFLKSAFRGLYRKAFRGFRWIFTQDEASKALLAEFAGTDRISVAGDTRFDRALELPEKFSPVPGVEEFVRGEYCIVAGSPWPADEAVLLPAIRAMRPYGVRWIIAPHEIDEARIAGHVAGDPEHMARYSSLDSGVGPATDVLWIDNIGMLSRLYHYADMVYIGGGFGAGIHNIQEPAVYGNPVVFGPNYKKFREAVDLVEAYGAFAVKNHYGIVEAFRLYLENPGVLEKTRERNRAYMHSMAGATGKVMEKVRELGLL